MLVQFCCSLTKSLIFSMLCGASRGIPSNAHSCISNLLGDKIQATVGTSFFIAQKVFIIAELNAMHKLSFQVIQCNDSILALSTGSESAIVLRARALQ